MRTKSREFFLSVIEGDFDIIAIAETWLCKSFNSCEYFPSNYNVFRRDRHVDMDFAVVGGGILFAVKENLNCQEIKLNNVNELEILLLKLQHDKQSVFLCLVYMPSNSTFAKYEEMVHLFNDEIFSKIDDADNLVVIGDFNLSKVNWEFFDGLFTPFNNNDVAAVVLDNFSAAGFNQYNTVLNQNGKLLDLIFTSADVNIRISACDDLSGSSSIYHTPVHIQLNLFNKNFYLLNDTNKFIYDFRNGDYDGLNLYLGGINWTFLDDRSDLELKVRKFYEILTTGIQDHFSCKQYDLTAREPWFNSKLIHLRNRKTKAYRAFTRSKCDKDYRIYSSLGREFKTLNRFLYNNYMLDIKSKISSNPKRKRNGFSLPSNIQIFP